MQRVGQLSRGRIEGLDVIRGIAIALVMLEHAVGKSFENAGIVGVAIFFTLSGYLVTGLIVGDLQRSGRVRWKRFYLHRLFRLMPALALLLVVYTIVEAVWNPLNTRQHLWPAVLIGATYTADLNLPVVMGGLSHLWSVSVEEQFYLVWPGLLWVAARRGIAAGRVSLVGAAAMTIIFFITSALIADSKTLYILPTSWAASMAVGAAAFCYRETIDRWIQGTRCRVCGVGGLIVLIVLAISDADQVPLTLLPPLIAVASVGLIWEARRWVTVPSALWPAFRLGTISYAAYLWNWPVSLWILDAKPGINGPVLLISSVGITVAAAAVSWVTVEALGRVARRRADARDRNLDTVTA